MATEQCILDSSKSQKMTGPVALDHFEGRSGEWRWGWVVILGHS